MNQRVVGASPNLHIVQFHEASFHFDDDCKLKDIRHTTIDECWREVEISATVVFEVECPGIKRLVLARYSELKVPIVLAGRKRGMLALRRSRRWTEHEPVAIERLACYWFLVVLV